MTSRRRIRKQLAADRETAFHDARRLALDLARGQSGLTFDTLRAGVVLKPGETAYRHVPAMYAELTGYAPAGWGDPTPVTVLVTDRRAFMRWPDRSLISLWWNSVQGLDANLQTETVVLDYGDGTPRCLSGPTAPVLAVAAIAAVYGIDAILRHPALASLRTPVTLPGENLSKVQRAPRKIQNPKAQQPSGWWPTT